METNAGARLACVCLAGDSPTRPWARHLFRCWGCCRRRPNRTMAGVQVVLPKPKERCHAIAASATQGPLLMLPPVRCTRPTQARPTFGAPSQTWRRVNAHSKVLCFQPVAATAGSSCSRFLFARTIHEQQAVAVCALAWASGNWQRAHRLAFYILGPPAAHLCSMFTTRLQL